jgi:hypothetical protein
MAQQQEIQVPQFQPLPPLPLFRSPLGAPVHFLSLVFLFLLFHSFSCCSLIDAGLPYTLLW